MMEHFNGVWLLTQLRKANCKQSREVLLEYALIEEKDMVTPQEIKQWIEQGLPGAKAEVTGDGAHFEATVICAAFAGKNMLAQHRMVYDALGDKMKSTIHALSLRTMVQ